MDLLFSSSGLKIGWCLSCFVFDDDVVAAFAELVDGADSVIVDANSKCSSFGEFIGEDNDFDCWLCCSDVSLSTGIIKY